MYQLSNSNVFFRSPCVIMECLSIVQKAKGSLPSGATLLEKGVSRVNANTVFNRLGIERWSRASPMFRSTVRRSGGS